jgi:hypothetical protein
MGVGPGKFFFLGVTATMVPALVGAVAATGVILTGEGDAAVLF